MAFEPTKTPTEYWWVLSNRLLLQHIRRALAADPCHYGPVQPYHFRAGEKVYSPEQERSTAVLVAAKQAWARDMGEWQAEHGRRPDVAYQRSEWADTMTRAEAEVRRQLAT